MRNLDWQMRAMFAFKPIEQMSPYELLAIGA